MEEGSISIWRDYGGLVFQRITKIGWETCIKVVLYNDSTFLNKEEVTELVDKLNLWLAEQS